MPSMPQPKKAQEILWNIIGKPAALLKRKKKNKEDEPPLEFQSDQRDL